MKVKVDMRRRIVKSIVIFYIVILFAALLGFLLPAELTEPAEKTNTEIVSQKTLIPGGFSVGMQMDVKGALIVGVEQESGPEIGDMIVKVNDNDVSGPEDVMGIVGDSGEPVELTVVRNQKRLQFQVTPYFDADSQTYKLGLWIKEKIAGIGTLTFFDPETSNFAALGHGIYEPETGTLLETKKGKLLHTRVEQVNQGRAGSPGSLSGRIYNFETPIGDIIKNTDAGVYGTVSDESVFANHQPLPVGTAKTIKEGNAVILTTIDGTQVETFSIEITKVSQSVLSNSRNLKLKVTDQRLLENCGGIVQGMSGSPIIQDGKIVGAVTHVLVNDPTRGYGILIEEMLEAADVTNH
ncbi:MAG: SpoIVB peptidase [Firmicutes bacterium]|nr:SpoIVB peptidase [Bacillota bacterium]